MNGTEQRAFLNKVLDIERSIGVKYKLLRTLEQSNLQAQTMFLDAKKSLENAWLREKELFDRINLSYEDILRLINIISKSFNINPNISLEELLLANNSEFNPQERLLFFLKKLKSESDERKNEIIQNSLPIYMIKTLPKNFFTYIVRANMLYQQALFDNYYLILMSFLDNNVCYEEKKVQDQMIHTKYLIPYLHTSIEQEFLNKNFKIPESLYLNHRLVGDFNFVSTEMQNLQSAVIMHQKFCEIRDRLLLLKNEEVWKGTFETKILPYFLRSGAIFLDEELLSKSKENFDEIIKRNDFMFQNRSESIALLENVYSTTKKDKSLHKYLSKNPF